MNLQKIAAAKIASGEWPSSIPLSHQQFYEEMIDVGYFIVTPDGIEATEAYERFNDGSPAT